MKILIKPCSFNDILPIWESQLWPARKSPIRAQSTMLLSGGTDMSLYNNEVYFYQAVVDNSVVGVNSVFKTGVDELRSRGLFVFPDYRNQSVGRLLLEEAVRFAKLQNAKKIWSLPRVTALPVYLKTGFKESHRATEETVEFGPNVYVVQHF